MLKFLRLVFIHERFIFMKTNDCPLKIQNDWLNGKLLT